MAASNRGRAAAAAAAAAAACTAAPRGCAVQTRAARTSSPAPPATAALEMTESICPGECSTSQLWRMSCVFILARPCGHGCPWLWLPAGGAAIALTSPPLGCCAHCRAVAVRRQPHRMGHGACRTWTSYIPIRVSNCAVPVDRSWAYTHRSCRARGAGPGPMTRHMADGASVHAPTLAACCLPSPARHAAICPNTDWSYREVRTVQIGFQCSRHGGE